MTLLLLLIGGIYLAGKVDPGALTSIEGAGTFPTALLNTKLFDPRIEKQPVNPDDALGALMGAFSVGRVGRLPTGGYKGFYTPPPPPPGGFPRL